MNDYHHYYLISHHHRLRTARKMGMGMGIKGLSGLGYNVRIDDGTSHLQIGTWDGAFATRGCVYYMGSLSLAQRSERGECGGHLLEW